MVFLFVVSISNPRVQLMFMDMAMDAVQKQANINLKQLSKTN
jgi:hypothetical protein